MPEQLAALHLASPDGIPNVAGMLIHGREPTTFIPGRADQLEHGSGLTHAS